MTRQWTEEETTVLKKYVDSHLRHCDGLNGSYWDGLFLALEGVRRAGDSALKKPQVSNKIIQFRKREVSCSHILQYGTKDDKTRKLKNCKKYSKSKVGIPEPVSTANTSLHAPEPRNIDQPSTVEYDAQNTICTEKALTASSVLLKSCESKGKDECKTNLNTPLRSDMVEFPNPCASSDTQSGSCASLKRIRSDDSCPPSSSSRRQKRRIKQKYATKERCTHGEWELKTQAVQIVAHAEEDEARRLSHRDSEQMQENSSKVLQSSKESPVSDTLSFIEVEAFPWQDQMLRAWQGHLAYQDIIHITQQEPIDHREVLYTIEDISNRIGEASEAMQRMFPSVLDVSRLGASGSQTLALLTGYKTQSEAADALEISQSLAPLSIGVNLLRAFIGATVYQWVFESFQLATPGMYCHDMSRTILDNFIQRECPKLWTGYQNLYHYQFLSTYNEERILSEAKKMANDVYTLLSSAYSATDNTHGPTLLTDRLTFSTAFPIQAQHYQTFKNSTIEAYRIALDLRVSLAKCNDLTYEFHFPKMRDTFDATCMEVKNATGDDNTVNGKNQSIALCLLPSMWSRAGGESDYGKPSTLVTKAIVLM